MSESTSKQARKKEEKKERDKRERGEKEGLPSNECLWGKAPPHTLTKHRESQVRESEMGGRAREQKNLGGQRVRQWDEAVTPLKRLQQLHAQHKKSNTATRESTTTLPFPRRERENCSLVCIPHTLKTLILLFLYPTILSPSLNKHGRRNRQERVGPSHGQHGNGRHGKRQQQTLLHNRKIGSTRSRR